MFFSVIMLKNVVVADEEKLEKLKSRESQTPFCF